MGFSRQKHTGVGCHLEAALKSFLCSPHPLVTLPPPSKPLMVHQILLVLRIADPPFAIRETPLLKDSFCLGQAHPENHSI